MHRLQLLAAQKKLNQDLDLARYLRTVNKVRCIEKCHLDEKQQIMLKYNSQRVVEIKLAYESNS